MYVQFNKFSQSLPAVVITSVLGLPQNKGLQMENNLFFIQILTNCLPLLEDLTDLKTQGLFLLFVVFGNRQFLNPRFYS